MTEAGASSTLQLNSVWKSYGTKPVLRGFTGAFLPGRIAALVGPNGAGKTTLLRIAAGLQHIDSGSVSGGKIVYYGGFDLLPTRDTINNFRRALGLPTVAEGTRRMSRLSRGELHTVGLDVAFELASDVLLLDEPWTALEPDAREALNVTLRSMVEGRVVICSSHDLDEVARVADDVVFLAEGAALWKRRGDDAAPFDRDELIRVYRETKKT